MIVETKCGNNTLTIYGCSDPTCPSMAESWWHTRRVFAFVLAELEKKYRDKEAKPCEPTARK